MADPWADPTFDNPQVTDWPARPTAVAATPAAPAAAPADNPTFAGDPAYLAFQRALGLNRDTARQNTQQQIDTLNQQLPGQLQWLGHQNELADTGIKGGMEARGLYRSGETEQNLSNSDQAYGHAAGDLRDATANRIAALHQALSQQEAQWSGQDITEQQASADRQSLAKAQADVQQQLLDALKNGVTLPDLSSLVPGGVNGASIAGQPIPSLRDFNLSPSEDFIVQRESGGRTTARNASSGAFGIGQLNPSSGTLQSIARETGFDPYTTDPAQQVAMMRRYIADRYGSADAAAAHERRFGWY